MKDRPVSALRRLRARARALLWAEMLARALALPVGVLLAYVVAGLFGFAGPWLLIGVVVISLAALVWGGAHIRAPDAAEVDRRIEAASGLRHRPLAALADAPVTGGAMGAQIWQIHKARALRAVSGARAGWPAPFAAARDPFSLRALLLLLLATGLVVNGADVPARLGAAFAVPAWPFAGPAVNAWITPPAYTGLAPVLLGPGGEVHVLSGSSLSVIVDGSNDAIRLGGKALSETRLEGESRRADAVITASGVLSIGPWWHRLARWRIVAVPPSAPVITLGPVQVSQNGLGLSWRAADDYGLSALAASLRPLGYPEALPEGAALPAATGSGGAILETLDSPYGGIAVGVKLRATNLAGLSTITPPQTVTLPQPRLTDQTAIVLSIIRQNLALTPEQSPAISRQMMQVAAAPPSAISYAADAQLAGLAAALRIQAASVPDSVARLLVLIRQIEAGPDFEPAQALAKANQDLLQALARGAPDSAKLQQLLQRVQQALAQHLAALRPAMAAGAQAQNFDPSALDQMAERIAADEQAGRVQQAQAELQALAQALQALQNAQPMTKQEAAQAQAAAQAQSALAQLMQNQAALRDQTAQGLAKAAQQGGLQASLDGIRKNLSDAGISGLPGLSEAARNMADATAALTRQNGPGAQSAQGAAIANMQRAMAALQQSQQQSLAISGGGQAPDQVLDGASPDGDGQDSSLPGLNMRGNDPADAIEQQIIRMDSDPALPAATHQYLHRLLTPDP